MGLVLNEIHVVGAAIFAQGLCLAAQRGKAMSEPLRWEFPGGKVEPLESAQEALVREISEELGCSIQPGERLGSATVTANRNQIRLEVFAAEIISGEPRAHEHQEIRWLSPDELPKLEWAPADVPLVDAVANYLRELQVRNRSKAKPTTKPPTSPA